MKHKMADWCGKLDSTDHKQKTDLKFVPHGVYTVDDLNGSYQRIMKYICRSFIFMYMKPRCKWTVNKILLYIFFSM